MNLVRLIVLTLLLTPTMQRPIINTHEADPPSCFCETTVSRVNEDSTTSITSGETYHQESKNTKLPRLIHSKTIDGNPECIHKTNQPTDPASEFSKVLPDVQGSSDTNMKTILENHLRRTPSTADEMIIVGKIYNFAAAETVKAGEKSDSSQQGEVYRLQGKLDTALAERLRRKSDKTELLASRTREDIRKANDELQNVRKSQLDRAQLQLSKSEEHEKKFEVELEVLQERKEKSWSERYQASNESDRTYSEWQLAYKEWERVDSEIKKLPKIDPIVHLPIDKNQIQNLIDAYKLNEKRACAESQRYMGYATAAASLEKYECKKVEVDMISEMYERHRVELDRVRSERQRYQTDYMDIQKEEMDRLAARIVNYQQDRHEWTKEEQDKLDMKRRIALLTKTSSDQQERCAMEMNRLRCENEKVRDSSQTEVVRITQKLEQEEQDKEKLKVKFQESSQASQKELDRLVEEREKLAKEIQTTKTENERLRKELESSQQGAKEEVIKLQNIIVSMQNELDVGCSFRLN